jgi:hypothetical protein
MAFLAEQHLVAAKLVRRNGATRTGAERELFIRKSKASSSACASWRKIGAASVWTISIGRRLPPIGVSLMSKFFGLRRRISTVHPLFPMTAKGSVNS